MYVLKQDNKYLTIHKDSGNYELSDSLTKNIKTFELICDAIEFADKFKNVFNLKVTILND